jgi:sugar phosphate isomerase/epimerase
MVTAAASAGITELWTATASYQFRLAGLHACDRFRTDVSWEAQLSATASFLHRLAPVLRHAGVHLNLETHEEITSFEVVRLVEEVGPDVLGITFDTANVLVRGEDPVAAAARVAPYVRSTHIRDAALGFSAEGISRFLVPVGEGVIDWQSILSRLDQSGAMLSIEGISRSRAEMTLYIHDPIWQGAHPDMTVPEILEIIGLTRDYELRASAGLVPNAEALREPLAPEASLEFIRRSAERLRYYLNDLPSNKTLERT